MKVTILYFSQTGNTQKVAETMAKEFERAGHSAASLSITQVKLNDLVESDIIGIGTPTFESHAPLPIKNFIRSLPALSGKRVFVFATCGGASGTVLSDVTTLLIKKGANVVGSFLTMGEVHHPAPCIVGTSKNRPNEADLNSAKRFAFALSQQMNSASMIHYGLKPKKGFYTIVGKITRSEKLIRLLEPKPKRDVDRCQQCRRCVRECPMDTISINKNRGHVDTCIRCYRCVNVCKYNAYTVNWWFGNIVVFTLWNRYFMHWFGEYDKTK